MAILSLILVVLWILRIVGLFLTAGTTEAMAYITVIYNLTTETNEAKPNGDGPNG